MSYIIIAFIVIIIFALALLFFFKKNKKSLEKCDLKDFSCHLKNISTKKVSDKEKIIDYDKLYHKILLKA